MNLTAKYLITPDHFITIFKPVVFEVKAFTVL